MSTRREAERIAIGQETPSTVRESEQSIAARCAQAPSGVGGNVVSITDGHVGSWHFTHAGMSETSARARAMYRMGLFR